MTELIVSSIQTSLQKEGNSHNSALIQIYHKGIPTLRSTTHRVKYSSRRSKGREHDKPFCKQKNKIHRILPNTVRKEHILKYDFQSYNLSKFIVQILDQSDLTFIGKWNQDSSIEQPLQEYRLHTKALTQSKNGGTCEKAQEYLSHLISSDAQFLKIFDSLMTNVVIPWFKALLNSHDDTNNITGKKIKFYYQRPPTLRLQPGPSISSVSIHRDIDYGHQEGELNFWLPLVNLTETGNTFMWVESMPNVGDYHPLIVKVGEIVSFHGSLCRHYVPANHSCQTRVSLDFRIGAEDYFDPEWKMIGTRADHTRKMVIQ